MSYMSSDWTQQIIPLSVTVYSEKKNSLILFLWKHRTGPMRCVRLATKKHDISMKRQAA